MSDEQKDLENKSDELSLLEQQRRARIVRQRNIVLIVGAVGLMFLILLFLIVWRWNK